VSFSGVTSSDSDGSIVSYAWNLGNGSIGSESTAGTTYTSAGTYPVVLTVTDNGGLTATDTVIVNVALQPNAPPVAVTSATSPTSGPAPLAVSFSSAGSYDPEGTSLSYSWNFGDGNTSTLASPSKTYSTLGTFTATLTVTDTMGATAFSTVSITVLPSSIGDGSTADVASFTLVPARQKGVSTVTAATVVRNSANNPVAGATVTVQWSGIISGTSTGTTNSSGQVNLSMVRTKKDGTVTAIISSVVTPAGSTYDPALFSEPLSQTMTFNSW
jgi:PKD repeat protein